MLNFSNGYGEYTCKILYTIVAKAFAQMKGINLEEFWTEIEGDTIGDNVKMVRTEVIIEK